MNTMAKNQLGWIMCLVPVIAISFVACQARPFSLLPTPSPTLKRIFDSQIQTQDLPRGWHYRSPDSIDIPEAVGRRVVYVTSDSDAFWNVSQDIYVYEKPDVAVSYYDYWVTRTIPPMSADSWTTPEELVFAGQADQIKVACLPSNVNGLPHHLCDAIGRYGDMIVILRGTVDDQWLTMADFRKLLEAMNQRIVATLDQVRQ